MSTCLIIGSGPAAAGAALALAVDPTQKIVVLDVGEALKPTADGFVTPWHRPPRPNGLMKRLERLRINRWSSDARAFPRSGPMGRISIS